MEWTKTKHYHRRGVSARKTYHCTMASLLFNRPDDAMRKSIEERMRLVQLELNYLEAKVMSEHELHGFSDELKRMFAQRGAKELEFQELQNSLTSLNQTDSSQQQQQSQYSQQQQQPPQYNWTQNPTAVATERRQGQQRTTQNPTYVEQPQLYPQQQQQHAPLPQQQQMQQMQQLQIPTPQQLRDQRQAYEDAMRTQEMERVAEEARQVKHARQVAAQNQVLVKNARRVEHARQQAAHAAQKTQAPSYEDTFRLQEELNVTEKSRRAEHARWQKQVKVQQLSSAAAKTAYRAAEVRRVQELRQLQQLLDQQMREMKSLSEKTTATESGTESLVAQLRRAKEEHDVAVANEETNVHALVALEEAESSYSQRIKELEKEMESLQISVVQVRKQQKLFGRLHQNMTTIGARKKLLMARLKQEIQETGEEGEIEEGGEKKGEGVPQEKVKLSGLAFLAMAKQGPSPEEMLYSEFVEFFILNNITLSQEEILSRMKLSGVTTRDGMDIFVSSLLTTELIRDSTVEPSFFDTFQAGSEAPDDDDIREVENGEVGDIQVNREEEEEEDDEDEEDNEDEEEDDEEEDEVVLKRQTTNNKQAYHEEKGEGETAEEEDKLCLICCDRLVYVAIGPCNHALICAKCIIRQRVLYKNRTCSLCKTEMDHFVVTSDMTRWKYEAWSDDIFGDICGGRLIRHSASDGFFDKNDEEILKFINNLLGFACGTCFDRSSNSVNQLEKHLLILHKLHMCQVCIATGRFFVSELRRFTPEELEQHQIQGAPADGLDPHPLCNFCRPQRFYDDQELYHHMIKEHFQCDVCRNMGNGNRFFKSYEVLNDHFHEVHYCCQQPECLSKRFVVFESEIDLQGHMARSHPRVKFKRSIMINFTVGRSGGQGPSSGGRDVHGSGANRGERNEMNFSDAFMRSQGSTGGDRSPNSSRPAVGMSSSSNSFPTLQEQQRHQEKGEKKKTSKTRRGSKGEQHNAVVASGNAGETKEGDSKQRRED